MRRRSRRRGDRSPLVPPPIPRSGRVNLFFSITDFVIIFRFADGTRETCYNPIKRDCNVSGSGPDRSRQPRELPCRAGGASSRQPEQWRVLWSALRQREQRSVERELELRRRPYPLSSQRESPLTIIRKPYTHCFSVVPRGIEIPSDWNRCGRLLLEAPKGMKRHEPCRVYLGKILHR